MHSVSFLTAIFAILFLVGCGDPKLHQVTGKVTLDGKPYERLLVYMRPTEGPVDQFRMGVGETDADGVLTLRSTAGDGLAEGTYRVSFSCMVPKSGGKTVEVLDPSEKHDDDRKLITVELVPMPYASDAESPVVVEIGDDQSNELIYDIPAK